MDFGRDIILTLLLGFPPFLFALTVHEFAHAFVAYRLGDHTASLQGRLTINPIPHMDPVGTVLVPILQMLVPGAPLIGWAKPVPVNPYNFRHPRKDNLLVSLAGPLSNFLLAILLALVIRLLLFYPGIGATLANPVLKPFYLMVQQGISISLILCVFNLLPIHPLDGSHVLEAFLNPRQALAYNRLAPYGFLILLVLLVTGVLGRLLTPPFSLLSLLLQGVMGVS